MASLLMIVYIFLLLGHIILYLNNKKFYGLVVVTGLLLFLLMSGHKYTGDGDAIDFFSYWYQYTNYETLVQKDFWFYYLFYSAQRIGVLLSLTFYQWWAIMTSISVFFIIHTIRKRKYNLHLFLVFFMIYYVFLFYGGLKFYYGFCVYQYAFSFLLRGNKRDNIKYVLLTCIAGGFHIMYYMFLIFTIINIKNKKKLIKIIVAITLGFTIISAITGKNMSFLQNIINSADNDRLSIYFSRRTNWGFILPIGIHILTTFYTWQYRRIVQLKSKSSELSLYADTLFYVNLMSVVFYPLFMIALTFMRLLTSLSLTTIIASGYKQDLFSKTDRLKMIGSGLILIMLFYFINVYLNGYWTKTFMPFFDSYYFKW